MPAGVRAPRRRRRLISAARFPKRALHSLEGAACLPTRFPERWPSGLRQRFAKPLTGLNPSGGSNPPLSARFCAKRENWRTRESGPERSDERGIRANRRVSGGLGRSPERSESIPLSPPAFAPRAMARRSQLFPCDPEIGTRLPSAACLALRSRVASGLDRRTHRVNVEDWRRRRAPLTAPVSTI